jgi:CheY-like chemotaxis protein
VEDDPSIGHVLTAILRLHGYEGHHVADGVKAIAWLESSPRPALILLDLMMPEMDGFQFRKWQLGSPDFNAIPVIVLSADVNAYRRSEDLGAVSGFLAKPFGMPEALDLIRRAIKTEFASSIPIES